MPKGRILVADRSADFLDKTEALLHAAGYEMLSADDGEAALAEAARPARRVDGVIAHMSLPRLDGTDLCRELRRLDETIPCYLMIPHDDGALVEDCLEAGARNVLTRPLKRTELLFAARSLMNLRSLLRARPGGAPAPDRRAGRVPPPPGADADARASFFQFELFKRLLAIELKRSKRYGFPLALLVVSPDGESMLPLAEGSTPVPGFDADAATIASRAVSQAVRDIDIPMQLAEDHILVVMPHTDLDGALVVAERIRRKARTGEGAITVSIGATSVEGGAARSTFDQLIGRANRALREARRAGGDRIASA